MQDENQLPPQSYSGPRVPTTSKSARLPGLVAVLIVLLALLIVPGVVERIQFASTRGEQRAKAEVARAELAALPDAESRYRLVAQSIAPSVVGIKTVQVVGEGFVDEWSGRGLYQATGEGSGVIVDEAGYIVTNYHVIERADSVRVELPEGRAVQARVIGRDPLTDLAVLKVNSGGVTSAPWGDSDELEVGDHVMAIGNPYGFDGTVTAGIISAKDRREVFDSEDPYSAFKEYLQTDAAVNPGNSGGPLVNLKGEIVGINTAIVGPTFQGISFAIPSRVAKEVYEKLKAGGTVSRGWLGVAPEEMNGRFAQQLGMDEAIGALVVGIVKQSPAAKAGFRSRDVIIKWNGQAIRDPTDLRRAIARTKPGSRATARIVRDGREMELRVVVGERP
jgi:S1-C subfamily serine protease